MNFDKGLDFSNVVTSSTIPTISYSKTGLRLIKFNSASVLHIPIEHADYVNKLITGVLVSSAIHSQSQVHL